MTTTEHLNRIAAKCREMLDGDDCKSVYAESGWRSTLAAIEQIKDLPDCGRRDWMAEGIIAAWPEELL